MNEILYNLQKKAESTVYGLNLEFFQVAVIQSLYPLLKYLLKIYIELILKDYLYFYLFLQSLIDQLCEDVKHVRPTVEKTRPNTPKNPDVDRLEEDVNRLNKRWGNCCMQGNYNVF